MHGLRPERRNIAYAAASAFLLMLSCSCGDALADDTSASSARRPFPRRDSVSARRDAGQSENPGGYPWWLGSAGVALVLAAGGWASLAARKYLPGSVTVSQTGLRVIGRTSLSPKHTVYLLKAGDRVLIVGTGPQGAPSLLGEMDPEPVSPIPRLDPRLGEES